MVLGENSCWRQISWCDRGADEGASLPSLVTNRDDLSTLTISRNRLIGSGMGSLGSRSGLGKCKMSQGRVRRNEGMLQQPSRRVARGSNTLSPEWALLALAARAARYLGATLVRTAGAVSVENFFDIKNSFGIKKKGCRRDSRSTLRRTPGLRHEPIPCHLSYWRGDAACCELAGPGWNLTRVVRPFASPGRQA